MLKGPGIRWPFSDPSPDVEAIEVHHLVPGRHEILDELLLRVLAGVDLGQGAQLGVRAEDEVRARGSPLQLAAGPIAALEHLVGVPHCLPRGAHVKQGTADR